MFLGGEEITGICMFTDSKDTLYFTGGFICITTEIEDEDGNVGEMYTNE